MFRDAFTKLDTLEVESLLLQLNPLLDGSPFDPRNATVLSVELPFYPGCRFLEVADHSIVPPRRAQVIFKIGSVTLLNWTNEPIYKLNENLPIQLNEKNVIDYVRFFFTFVRGRHGRFLVVETIDDISWKEEIPPAARKAIGNLIEPVRLRGIEKDGTYLLSVRMVFKDSLFKSKVNVTPQGLVSLSDEELVVEDMPILDDLLER